MNGIIQGALAGIRPSDWPGTQVTTRECIQVHVKRPRIARMCGLWTYYKQPSYRSIRKTMTDKLACGWRQFKVFYFGIKPSEPSAVRYFFAVAFDDKILGSILPIRVRYSSRSPTDAYSTQTCSRVNGMVMICHQNQEKKETHLLQSVNKIRFGCVRCLWRPLSFSLRRIRTAENIIPVFSSDAAQANDLLSVIHINKSGTWFVSGQWRKCRFLLDWFKWTESVRITGKLRSER